MSDTCRSCGAVLEIQDRDYRLVFDEDEDEDGDTIVEQVCLTCGDWWEWEAYPYE